MTAARYEKHRRFCKTCGFVSHASTASARSKCMRHHLRRTGHTEGGFA